MCAQVLRQTERICRLYAKKKLCCGSESAAFIDFSACDPSIVLRLVFSSVRAQHFSCCYNLNIDLWTDCVIAHCSLFMVHIKLTN